MKSFVSHFIVFGILATAPFALRAQQAGGPIRPPQSSGITGISIGGPVGVLNDQQRAWYLAAMKNEHGRLAELQAKLNAARQDVTATSVTGPFDENLVRQKALIAARIEAEIAVIHAKVFSQVQPPLTPEQIETIKTGKSGPIRPLGRQQLNPVQHVPLAGTNAEANGLPPKK
jgi:Spy/CpxP family protein refolding chaperone